MVRNYRKTLGTRSYRNYSIENLKKAASDVKLKKKTLRAASEFYGIPKSTIADRIKGHHEKKVGGQTILNSDEEQNLAAHIMTCAEWGFPLTEFDIRKIVQSYLNRKGVEIPRFSDNLPGPDWVKLFLSRHKHLTVQLVQNIKRNRTQVSHETIKEYFNLLKISLEGVPVENIINYDETNFSDDPGRPKVVCKRGVKHCDRIIDSTKTSVSVMMAASASGVLLPPFVVYKAKHRYEEWEENGPLGCRYSVTKSGWFESTVFLEWFRQCVLPYFRHREGRKVMIGDNLSSHVSLEVIQSCNENDIRFILLPPNSTHICQPLDVAFFAPVKKAGGRISPNGN